MRRKGKRGKKRARKPSKKWGKIGAPRSAKRREWLRKIRKRKKRS